MEEKKEKTSFEEMQALIKKTDKENPNPEDLKAMKKLLDENSTLVRLNEFSELAFTRVIESVTKSALMKELLERQIKEKRGSFGYETATIFEQMLIDQVILCHLRLTNTETLHTSKLDGSHSLAHGLYWDKRLNSAQRRFTKACETLAKVQKHLAEANLREQQAQNSRGKGAMLANKLLKDLTK
jgi:hypothetical protein